MIVFLFVFGVGTANIALSLEPIIAKTAVRANIQPKRPLTASVLTANLALLCSPAASATAYIISVMAGYHISMGQYLSIVLPTAIITMLMLSVFVHLLVVRQRSLQVKLHIRLKCQSNNHLQRNQIRRSWIFIMCCRYINFWYFSKFNAFI